MKQINGKNFINLDQYLNLDKLDSLDEEMCLAFAKSHEHILLGSPPTKSLLNFDKRQSYQDIQNKATLKYSNLNKRETEWYSLMKGGENHGYSLFLKNIKTYPFDFAYKALSDHCYFTPASKHFRFLFDWIDEQKCFNDYGRVLFFISHAGQSGMIHKDNVGIEHVRDKFIWITGKRFSKSLFLYDENTKEKVYSTSRSAFFDNQNYHGTENHNSAAVWSLRIDGVFNESWAKNAGIV